MSLNKKLDEHIKRIEETEDSWIIEYGKSEEEMKEANVTGAADGPYNTPKAFGKKKKKDVEVVGYKKVKESAFMRLAKETLLSEIRYTDYKKDESATSKQKVNRAIREINSKLYRIEGIINQNIKLKSETGVDESKYWKSTRSNLQKISEKMQRISERLRRF